MRRRDVDFVFDAKLLERLGGFVHDVQVAIATHDDGDKRLAHFQFSVLGCHFSVMDEWMVLSVGSHRLYLLYRRLLETAIGDVAPELSAFELNLLGGLIRRLHGRSEINATRCDA